MNSSQCFHVSSSQYGSITCLTFDSKYQQVICGTDLGIILWFHYDRSEIFHHKFLIENSSCSIHKIECHEENGMLLVHYSIIIDKNSLNEEPLSNVVQLYSYSFSALGSKLNIRDEATQFKVTGGPKLNFTLKEKSSYFEKKETGELIHCTRRIPLQNLQNSNFCIVWSSEKENEFSIYRKLGRTFLRLTLGTTFNLRGEECDSMIFLENTTLILRFRNVYVVYDYESKTIWERIVLEGDEIDIGKKEIQIVAKLVSNIEKNDISWKGYYFQRISICQPRLIACISLDGKILTFYNIRNENIVELFQELTIEELMSQNNEFSKLSQPKFSNIQETVNGIFATVEGLCLDMSTIQIIMKFTHPNINIPMKKDDFKLQKAFELIAEEKIRQAFNLLLDFEIDASDSLDFGYDSRELMLLHENHHIVLRKDLVHSKYSSILFNKDGSAKKQFRNEDENDEENEGQYFGVFLKRFLIIRRNNLRNLPQDFISIQERISIDNFIFLAHLTSGDIRKALQFVKEMDGIVYCSLLECNKVLDGGGIIGLLLSKDYIRL